MDILRRIRLIWNKLLYGWDLEQIGDTLIVTPDFSHWSVDNVNPTIDRDKFAQQIEEKGVKAIIYKGTDSYNGSMFTDVTAKFWWQIGEEFKLARGAYHWLKSSIDPTVAFNYHKNFESQYPTEFPYILDFEDTNINSSSDMLWRNYTWLGLADADKNEKTVVYSAPWYINTIKAGIPSSEWENKIGTLRNWPYWIARYSRYWPKDIWPWESFVGWQYTDSADYPYYQDGDQYWGNDWGILSKGLDLSLFDVEWLNKYTYTEEPPQDCVNILNEVLDLTSAVENNIRNIENLINEFLKE